MKTNDILHRKHAPCFTNCLLAPKPVRHLLAVSVTALVVMCATLTAKAQTAITKPIGLVSDMTTYLLTTSLTTAQRQALHAQNFHQLTPSARPLYLHAIATDVAYAVASGGKLPTSAVLAQHLQSVSSIYEAPAIPEEYEQLVSAEKVLVHQTLQELNVAIAGEIASNSSYQQAMYAGAVNGFMWWDDWW